MKSTYITPSSKKGAVDSCSAEEEWISIGINGYLHLREVLIEIAELKYSRSRAATKYSWLVT